MGNADLDAIKKRRKSVDDVYDEMMQQDPMLENFKNQLFGRGKFNDTGRNSEGPGEAVDSYVGAPVRAGIDSLVTAPPPRDAFDYGPAMLGAVKRAWGQVGKDPRTAPTGYDVASHMGIENPYLGAGVATAVDLAQLPIPGMGVAGKVNEVEKMAPEVRAILDKIRTPEQAVALKGAERSAYLGALDQAYGDQAKRAADMGFGKKTWFHGSTNDIDQFQSEFLGKSTNANSAKKGFFFAQDPSTAGDYADLSPSRAAIRAKANVGQYDKAYYNKLDELHQKYNPNGLDFPDWRRRFEQGLETVPDKDQAAFDEIVKARDNAWDTSPVDADEHSHSDVERIKSSLNKFENQKAIAEKTSPVHQQQENKINDEIKWATQKLTQYPQDADFLNPRLQQLQDKLSRVWPTTAPIDEINASIAQRKSDLIGAQDRLNSKGQNVLPVRLKGNKENIRVKDYEGQGYRDTTYSDEMKAAQDAGQTGVLFKNTYDPADQNNRVQQNIAAVFEPNQIRSTNAAFDPRFKDSSLLLAGRAGLPPNIDLSKLALIKALQQRQTNQKGE